MKAKSGNKPTTQIAGAAQKKPKKSRRATVQPRSPNGKQHAGEAAGSLAIIEADKMAASLTNEELAVRVRDGFAEFRPKVEKWLPLAIDLRARFEALRKQKPPQTILGCSTWEQFCDEVLDYSGRHVRRLMEGANPAVKYRNKPEHREKTKALPAPAVATESECAADWTDNEYIETCVDFVGSTLKPLKSDPQRLHRVAVSIAKEIAGDFLGGACVRGKYAGHEQEA